MSNPTLYLPKIPMVGKSGTLPPGTLYALTIGHDSACPCVDVAQDLTHCLCEHVNLYLETRALPEHEGGA